MGSILPKSVKSNRAVSLRHLKSDLESVIAQSFETDFMEIAEFEIDDDFSSFVLSSERHYSMTKTVSTSLASNGDVEKPRITCFCSSYWNIDSHASTHMCKEILLLKNLDYSRKGFFFENGKFIEYKGVGNFVVKIFGEDEMKIELDDVYFCPLNETNTLSVQKLENIGVRVIFQAGTCYFSKQGASTVPVGYMENKSDLHYRALIFHPTCCRKSVSTICIH